MLLFNLMCSFRLEQWSPTFLAPRTGFMENHSSTDWGVVDGFRMIQGHYIYCVLYFYYYYVCSMSHHQALDPRGWDPCFIVINVVKRKVIFWMLWSSTCFWAEAHFPQADHQLPSVPCPVKDKHPERQWGHSMGTMTSSLFCPSQNLL